jgi:hypothetical protein
LEQIHGLVLQAHPARQYFTYKTGRAAVWKLYARLGMFGTSIAIQGDRVVSPRLIADIDCLKRPLDPLVRHAA